MQEAEDDTDPGTDLEAETAAAGMKRKSPNGTTGMTSRYVLTFSLYFLYSNSTHQVEAVKSN